jgi:formylglycine-generating enzyme required for sulfatase activity
MVADLDERPVTRVQISNDFYMAKFEVTQGQWEAMMGENPSLNVSCGADCPVEQVGWWDAQDFLERLNEAEGVEGKYRLPTEAEWEYAARAGTSGDLYDDLDSIAWHTNNSGGKTQPVGQKEPNAFGLHDMIGNTWEWVHDWKGAYPGGTVADPTGPRYGKRRVVRGTGFTSIPKNCRVSSRLDFDSSWRDEAVGFRVVMTAQ